MHKHTSNIIAPAPYRRLLCLHKKFSFHSHCFLLSSGPVGLVRRTHFATSKIYCVQFGTWSSRLLVTSERIWETDHSACAASPVAPAHLKIEMYPTRAALADRSPLQPRTHFSLPFFGCCQVRLPLSRKDLEISWSYNWYQFPWW